MFNIINIFLRLTCLLQVARYNCLLAGSRVYYCLSVVRLQFECRVLRYERFCADNGKVDIKCLPPCSNSLEFHAKRANYQAAILRRSLDEEVEMPSPVGYG